MNDLEYRFATQDDAEWLAEMNQELIRDEGHRNRMSLAELERRMSDFLEMGYSVVIAACDAVDIGYALYRQDPDWIYLRQLFIKREMRRRGICRQMIAWLKENPWKNSERIRAEVLTGNREGISFWRTVGFDEYCITMEMENLK
ncbi:MAG: GNAT family N-acetyltransferase [Sedimentisphaerales bacterium]|jgi:N-acetylglutamate synthase-like GNAT family acetyltransferase|nr:GNAT family N-acetyltransferase [Sedimentisphaerales bacterium]